MSNMTAAVRPTPAEPLVFDIDGMTCAACAARVEKVLRGRDGVVTASVNYALERADVVLAPGTPVEAVIEAVDDAGYGASLRVKGGEVEAEARREAEAARTARRDGALFALAAILSVPLVLPMIAQPFGVDIHPPPLWQWALATPVQVVAGWRFTVGAFKAVRAGAANMDVLVALGTWAAYLFSVWMIVEHGAEHAHGHLYFEAASVVIAFILGGKLLEARAKRGTAAAVRALIALRPETARRVVDGREEEVPVAALRTGDVVAVRPGERLPVDGIVVDGRSEVDESMVTGESVPVGKSADAKVIGGTVNGTGALQVRATALGEDAVLARIVRAVEAAESAKPPVQALVDRVSAVFVPVVVVIALVTFAGWWIATGSIEAALVPAVSVLVIACPCALGLATPAAIVAGIGAAAKAGILVRRAEVLETAPTIDTVVFDKTGTLTEGTPKVMAVASVVQGMSERDVVATAAAVQSLSEHPLAQAVLRHAASAGMTPPAVIGFVSVPGRGVEGVVEGARVILGNEAHLTERGIDAAALGPVLARFAEDGLTPVLLAVDSRAVGALGLLDTARPTAREGVERLKERGAEVILLSGDVDSVARRVGGDLGIARIIAGVPPRGKSREIEALRVAGRRVAMVGDGVNDAPALAAADMGIAMGTGADVAIEAADVALMRPDPRLVAAALTIATLTRRKIRQNLVWAFIYNVIGLPLAAAGLLSPVVAGAAMALSSVSVVTNALLLARWRPDA